MFINLINQVIFIFVPQKYPNLLNLIILIIFNFIVLLINFFKSI